MTRLSYFSLFALSALLAGCGGSSMPAILDTIASPDGTKTIVVRTNSANPTEDNYSVRFGSSPEIAIKATIFGSSGATWSRRSDMIALAPQVAANKASTVEIAVLGVSGIDHYVMATSNGLPVTFTSGYISGFSMDGQFVYWTDTSSGTAVRYQIDTTTGNTGFG